MDTPNETRPETSFRKALFFAAVYIALLLPSLSFAWCQYADMADPPSLNAGVNHSFWLSGFGGWVWFGAAFAAPALALIVFGRLMGAARKAFVQGAEDNDRRRGSV